jgi:uncharacterized protein (TIGR02646 family)
MEKITKPPLSDIPSLRKLEENHVQWSKEFAEYLEKDRKSARFSWKGGLYSEMRKQLGKISNEHCSFCDSYPLGDTSKETIEHYYPKADYPLQSHDWDNLFYCCDKCQSEANKNTFKKTLKPDEMDYCFEKYFYFDLQSGKLEVMENLTSDEFEKATAFLIRYGISDNPKRNKARQTLFSNIHNYFLSKPLTNEIRERDEFMCRYVYDYYKQLHNLT